MVPVLSRTIPECRYLLLRSVYFLREEIMGRKSADVTKEKPKGSWRVWFHHPAGVQLLGLSYAVLYLTVMSPHGPLLTAYLSDAGLSASQLSALRGAGALAGVAGVTVQPLCFGACGEKGSNLLAVSTLGVSGLAAAASFALSGVHDDHRVLFLYGFAFFVVLARPGLYAFELGVLNQEQELVDEKCRSGIGAVDNALTSAATLIMYIAGTVLNDTSYFGWLVNASAACLLAGVVLYSLWCMLFHSHKHRHVAEIDDHGHSHDGHIHVHHHAHTTQAQRMLDEEGWHVHVHFNPVWRRGFSASANN
mmetsp:Transcript_123508/g.283187  ORF Transcript_123508/g.283187 Transcript_123508/m.283187 type:complete len:306 (+) Transcript_123508:594-1511(+)